MIGNFITFMNERKIEQAKVQKRERKNIEFGVAHIRSTFNNTIVTITDKNGNALPLKVLTAKDDKIQLNISINGNFNGVCRLLGGANTIFDRYFITL